MGSLFAAAALAATLTAAPSLSETDAVGAALARSRDLVAAKLGVDAAEVDRSYASVWPNPIASYSLGNLVLPPGNPQEMGINPGFFDQTIHTVSLSQTLDVWFKHTKRVQAAERGTEAAHLMVDQATREVIHNVRGAFADALHGQEELELARESRGRYDETARLSKARWTAGEISATEFKKIELEQLRYVTAEREAKLASELSREKLAEILTLGPRELTPTLTPTEPEWKADLTLDALTQRALDNRADLKAQRKAIERAQASLDAQRREAYPDISIGAYYSRDTFVVSGDNPNTIGVNVSLPLPILDRNQGGIGHAAVDLRTAENETARLELAVRHDVADAVAKIESAREQQLLLHDEVAPRAEKALEVAERAFHAGSTSLLELLEAQRTYVEVRHDAVDALLNYRQAAIDVAYATGGTP